MEEIIHEIEDQKGGFYYELNGTRLGEMVYRVAGEGQIMILHTEVDEWLKGQGVGKKLLQRLVEYARENKIRVTPICPFARATFIRMKEWQDVLA